ncbi:MAG: SDR family oxidoreductase [Umezawaea sp.]
MKVVLTGATGFIGSEVLRQLVDRPDVTLVTCLTRKPLAVGSDKVRSIVLDDFTSYDDDRVLGHDACVWTLGSRHAPGGDKAEHERLTVDFPLAFASTAATGDFRFCYVSGWGTSPTTPQGRAETGLRELAARKSGFEVFCFRPAKVLPVGTNALVRAVYGPLSVGVDALARAMVRTAVDRPSDTPGIVENKQIRVLGH